MATTYIKQIQRYASFSICGMIFQPSMFCPYKLLISRDFLCSLIRVKNLLTPGNQAGGECQ